MTPEQSEYILSLDRDGELTPELLVQAAEPDDSPIHDLFQWDDVKAGYQYRLSQARSHIGRVRVEIVRREKVIQRVRYIRNPEIPAREQGYVKTSILATRQDMALRSLQAEFDQVVARIARMRAIARELKLSAQCEAMLATALELPAEAAAG